MDDLIILGDPRPQRADALKNRELLLSVAQRLFAELGVEAVTMSAVAEAAGVGKGTLYRHFKDKIALCEELLDTDQRALQERTLERLRTQTDPTESLVWFVGEVVAFVLRNRALLPRELVTALRLPAHYWWRQTIRGLLEQIGSNGMDADYVADALYVMVDVQTVIFQHQDRGYDDARIIAGVQALARKLVG